MLPSEHFRDNLPVFGLSSNHYKEIYSTTSSPVLFRQYNLKQILAVDGLQSREYLEFVLLLDENTLSEALFHGNLSFEF